MASDITKNDWREVDEVKDRQHVEIGYVDDDLFEEIPHFVEFIKPMANKRPDFKLGGLWRLWRDYRGEDVIYSLSLNELKRIWTALAVVGDGLPGYCKELPEPCILYDNGTHAIIRKMRA